MGDFNGRIGNDIIGGIKQRFNERERNESGEELIEFCAHNQLRINNTFYPHKPQHMYTWRANDRKSVIDHIITNRVVKLRALTSASVGSDHHMILCKTRINIKPSKRKQPLYVEKMNIEALQDDTTKWLYTKRITEQIKNNAILETDTVEESWNKLRNNTLQASKEAIGTRRINVRDKKNNTRTCTKEKKSAYTIYITKKNEENRLNYIEIRNEVNAKIKKIKQEYWTNFTKEMERDLYTGQKKVWKMLRRRKANINEYLTITNIETNDWQQHFKQLYENQSDEEENIAEIINNRQQTDENYKIGREEVSMAIKKLKNGKAPGEDGIPNELIKYAGESYISEMTTFFNKILQEVEIPKEWTKSITIPIFKKGSKKDPSNYKGITLLARIIKVFTSIA